MLNFCGILLICYLTGDEQYNILHKIENYITNKLYDNKDGKD